MSFLHLDHVSYHYFYKKGYTKALENVSFTVPEGSFISLLGPSGCGKTTLLSIIAGILEPSEGTIQLEEKPLEASKLDIGYMLQQDYLFPWKTILENVLMGPKIQKMQKRAMKEKAIKLLEDIGLSKVIDSYPQSLSGGMRQRAALVRTLLTDPKLLLLDEPFSALDFQTKLKLEDLVSGLLKEFNKTSVLVTHDIGEAIAMSDKIFLMKANPGEIHEVFEVPIEIRNLTPFQARKHLKYQQLFDRVWEELNSLESQTVSR
ncbi:ABC transporter ATP-binding protein [Aquibacillus koreensis]|uniref:ABC transporter ATP-binding protein n=1 Tax=Aquibacillus koreensis TaxID=279446 RepID=A0A9X4AJD5_9BACI|nr:ABC transporter ATP-binding protein [Aquibacillus koreensis]MCT2535839.1 ABC transporter ATP-binding protein [Aquibacillus koreensis]MDC3420295.1 ABC transporter ATP-binding protein [Aquibacillus koreensis]